MDTSNLDLQMPLLVVCLAGAAGIIVYLVSVFGIREKTFEEAIAAQKEISVELLGARKEQKKKLVKRKVKNNNPKDKEEKQVHKEEKVSTEKDGSDKQHPKEKEHISAATVAASQSANTSSTQHQHTHVEICPKPIILDIQPPRRPSMPNLGRRDSVKSILMNKGEISPVIDTSEATVVNNFETMHPKDDFEMKKQYSHDEDPCTSAGDDEAAEEVDGINENDNGENSAPVDDTPVQVEEIIPKVEIENTEQEPPAIQHLPSKTKEINVQGNLKKPSKKSKKTLQSTEASATTVLSTIEKATLSSDEIQNLIEHLLNRQLDAGMASEWINKSKSDTTASLKKVLGEREQQLSEKQLAIETLQIKLKDVKMELSTERNRLTGTKKQLEERNSTLHQELTSLQHRLQQLNNAIGEKQSVERQLQELQRRFQSLHDENVNLKKVLTADQSFRMKSEGLEREAEALRTQCSHLESQLKSSFQSNNDLGNQLRSLQEHVRGIEMNAVEFDHIKAYNTTLQERESQFLNDLKRAESKLVELDAEKNAYKDKLKDTEAELRLSKEEADRRIEESQENEKNAKNLLQDTKSSLDQVERLLQAKETEVSHFKHEAENLKEELRKLNVKSEGEEHELIKRLNDAEQSFATLALNKDKMIEDIKKANTDIHTLQNKNEELSNHNAQLAENLRVAELNFEAHLKSSNELLEATKKEVKDAVDSSIRSQLEISTGIAIPKSSSNWLEAFSSELSKHQKQQEEQVQQSASKDNEHTVQVQKLQAEVEHYEAALKTTESLLRSLEQSIENEEKEWKEKLRKKEQELEKVIESSQKISDGNNAHLEEELRLEKESNSKLIHKIEELELALTSSQKEDNVSLVSLDELKAENEELRAEIRRLSYSPSDVTNGNGTSSNNSVLSASNSTIDSPSGDVKSNVAGDSANLLSPTETKKKKKAASAKKEKKT